LVTTNLGQPITNGPDAGGSAKHHWLNFVFCKMAFHLYLGKHHRQFDQYANMASRTSNEDCHTISTKNVSTFTPV
jgi:hypothetical protein